MAIIHMTGWETGNINKWIGGGSPLSVGAVRTGHSGSYCCTTYGLSGYLPMAADDEIYGHIRFEPYNNSGGCVLCLRNATTYLSRIYTVPTTGFLRAVAGSSTLATATVKPILTGGVYTIQFYIKIADSGGRFVLKVDDTIVVDYTGDTKPDANTQFDNVFLGFDGTNQGGYVDDIVLDDANYPGNNLRIEGLVASGAGSTTQWDPSTGANYQTCDEKPPSDTDYNSTNVTDEIDTFAMGNLVASIQSILAVQVNLRAAYDGAPTPTHVRPVVRVNGTDYPSGSDLSPGSSFSHLSFLWELNPDDSAAWEEADITALEAGYKATA